MVLFWFLLALVLLVAAVVLLRLDSAQRRRELDGAPAEGAASSGPASADHPVAEAPGSRDEGRGNDGPGATAAGYDELVEPEPVSTGSDPRPAPFQQRVAGQDVSAEAAARTDSAERAGLPDAAAAAAPGDAYAETVRPDPARADSARDDAEPSRREPTGHELAGHEIADGEPTGREWAGHEFAEEEPADHGLSEADTAETADEDHGAPAPAPTLFGRVRALFSGRGRDDSREATGADAEGGTEHEAAVDPLEGSPVVAWLETRGFEPTADPAPRFGRGDFAAGTPPLGAISTGVFRGRDAIMGVSGGHTVLALRRPAATGTVVEFARDDVPADPALRHTGVSGRLGVAIDDPRTSGVLPTLVDRDRVDAVLVDVPPAVRRIWVEDDWAVATVDGRESIADWDDTVVALDTLVDVLADGERARVVLGNDEEHVVHLAAGLRRDADGRPAGDGPDAPVARAGDSLLVDPKLGVAYELVPRAEVDELLLEEVPTVAYSDIGGLGPQIEQIRDAIELPFVHHELYREFHLAPPKGVLLYGPPGCGKTLIAKAVAHSLAEASARARGEDTSAGVFPNSYFLSIKGPELLNKYVGETERHIRSIFRRARDKATSGNPVIVFFDEMDSIFRTRGTGVSSDMETTIVPQLLAEIDGVEDLRNVIVIGASNREDMIDPAILRPGRLDLKIRIDRPDRDAARDILSKYVTPDLRFDPDEVPAEGGATHVDALLDRVVDRLYTRDDSTRYVELVFASGRRSALHLADLTSGAMLRNVVDRAKKLAIKDIVHGTGRGLTTDDFLDAVDAEFAENTDLPNTSNPQEWARLSGVRGERVVEVLVPERARAGEGA